MNPAANPTIPPTPKMSRTNRKAATLIAPKRNNRKTMSYWQGYKENDNEFDFFGKYIACHLKKLSEHSALESMAYIQSYLLQQRLKNHTNISHQIVHSEENRADSAASISEYYEGCLYIFLQKMGKKPKNL